HATQAGMALLDDGETTCCYSRSDKYWITDPQGIAWEQFHTLDNIPVFSEPKPQSNEATAQACCAPAAINKVATVQFVKTRPQVEGAKACC
ncbi:MAG: ArsI/CadI family heavy metal resistance metalloenzyme, partial [Polaromonas sp.]